MNTQLMTPESLAASVIAVPPVARDSDYCWNEIENARIIKQLEAGGVSTLLYGGNAALAHVALSEYAALLDMLVGTVSRQTIVVPSVGPHYGMMMDQANILRNYSFPTVMLLPSSEAMTPLGLATGIRRFVDRLGRPVVLYIKHDGMVDVETVQQLMSDGLLSWIKYAVVRKDPSQDPYLRNLINAVGTERIVSGMGEQPALIHMRDFGLKGFTAGCVCVAPALSTALLQAIKQQDFATAEHIRQQFAPLESLRDKISPVRVLHAAVRLAGIADTGPITPFWSPVSSTDEQAIEQAARELLQCSLKGH